MLPLFNYRGKNGAILTPLKAFKVVKDLKRKRVEVMNMMEELDTDKRVAIKRNKTE